MALCKYSTFVGGTCGASSENPANVECVTIGQCTRELHGHLKLLKISHDPGVDSESKLVLMRAGMVHETNTLNSMYFYALKKKKFFVFVK